MMLLGAHMSIAGGVFNAILEGEKLGCTTIQIFTKSSNQWRAKELGEDELTRYHAEQKRTGIYPVIAHDSYLINLGSPDEALLTKSREAFAIELQRCEKLKIPYLVTHPGAHMGQGEEEGLKKIAASLDWIFDHTGDLKSKVALESTAGQGTSLGYRFEQLAHIIELSAHPERIKVCIDTCHIFAAGYDISNEDSYQKTISEFDRIIGLRSLAAIHLNDSKKGLGSKVDRHEHIGKGFIGEKAFGFFMKDKRFEKIPKLLETSKENDMDTVNLGILRRLAGASGKK
ncbi:MAG TPA: deoxyribonuclease IV [candidate division Zixibacteria bacterium]|nr:deoxyribonuclease IV [candidate division Zixibacteria bacterium]